MDVEPFSPRSTVADALRCGAPVASVFMRHRTACVGCSLARFCSLRDVAATYELDLELLVQELEGVTHATNSSTKRSNL